MVVKNTALFIYKWSYKEYSTVYLQMVVSNGRKEYSTVYLQKTTIN